jgi:hypothetical protein
MNAAVIGIVFCTVFLLATAGQRTGAGIDDKPEDRNRDKFAIQNHAERREKNPGQWFADPERGWIRSEDRPRKDQENSRDRAQNSAGRTGGNWEY